MPAKISNETWVKIKHDVADSGCWIFKGALQKDGYGSCNRNGHSLAHRAYYSILKGELIPGLELDHLCKNRNCVNPDHLEQVTHSENVSRGNYKYNHRNGRKTHCKRGHEFNDQNTLHEIVAGSKRRKCIICRRMNQNVRYYKNKAGEKDEGRENLLNPATPPQQRRRIIIYLGEIDNVND